MCLEQEISYALSIKARKREFFDSILNHSTALARKQFSWLPRLRHSSLKGLATVRPSPKRAKVTEVLTLFFSHHFTTRLPMPFTIPTPFSPCLLHIPHLFSSSTMATTTTTSTAQLSPHPLQSYTFSFTPFLQREYRFGLDPNRPYCKAFREGHCPLGNNCPDKHQITHSFNNLVCKHWLRGLCKKGDQCEFLHEYNLYVIHASCSSNRLPAGKGWLWCVRGGKI